MKVELTNQTRKLCVIGDPVEHSKSPLIQNTMIQALGLDYLYMAQYVPRGGAAAWLEAAKTAGYAGFNATMPHKLDLVPLMDELDEDARMYGAVNTVALRNGRAYGFNTDGRGFVQALRDEGIGPEGRTAVLLGAGGAAKSVALKLVQQGAKAVFACNRTLEKAGELCRLDRQGRLIPAGFDLDTLRELCTRCSLLVNCTSLGMTGVAGQYQDLTFLDALPEETPVCDLIYAPAETLFLKEARRRGHPAFNGLGMLIWQAVFALEHFTETKIDGQAMKHVLKNVC
ncbi:MAG: shikimate dehydrogenase [Oscillospiraceae bacterium]|nr:shikimate dehydrogenase [Oscillospiraceae bacterium]